MAAQNGKSAGFDFELGTLLAGKYRLERVLGEGGIGVVVAATHEDLEQRVAVKYLKPIAKIDPVLRERFLREARLAAKLKSDHVVRVHDVGTSPDGTPYMVMELLEGRDLSARLDLGALPAGEAVDYVLQACEALAETHAMGIVHRDLKPENIFLAARAAGAPIVKVLDFGISKLTEKHPDSRRSARLTGVTDRFGTPQYMPPEQLNASTNVDARSDIWALGVILHELVTGARPFHGDSLPEVCANVLGRTYPGFGHYVSPLPGLEAVVRTCLQKNPADRFRNVGELAQALAPFAPPRARDCAERVAEVVRAFGESIHPATPVPMPPPTPVPASAKTVSVWTDVAHPAPKRGPVFGLVSGAGTLALVLVVALAQLAPFARRATSAAHGRAIATACGTVGAETTRPLNDDSVDLPAPSPPKPRAAQRAFAPPKPRPAITRRW